MFTHELGYVFDARRDARDKLGVIEKYSYFNKYVNLIVGVKQDGTISDAVYCDKHMGFKCLNEILKKDCPDDDIEHFLRSRRALYAVIGNVTMIGIAKVNITTKELSFLELYVPISDNLCDGKPVIICDKLETINGFHHKIVSATLYNSLITKVKNELLALPLDSKVDYIRSRIPE